MEDRSKTDFTETESGDMELPMRLRVGSYGLLVNMIMQFKLLHRTRVQ